MRKRLMAFVLVIAMALSMNMTVFAAGSDTVLVGVVGEFGQTEARTMLDMVNEFRTGNDAWYWNQDNTTKTTLTDLNELTYDYDLEQIAMIRALEIAISFSHTRPNGKSCFTATYGSTKTQSYGENIAAIAAGRTTAEAAFIGWREDNKLYAGQGHRRNMLSSDFTAIGIGHVVYNGYHYWVQEFGYRNSNAGATSAFDKYGLLGVDVDPDQVTDLDVESMGSIEIGVGEKVEFPDTVAYILLEDTWPGYPCTVLAIPECSVDKTKSNGEIELSTDDEGMDWITGVKAGTVVLNLTVTMGERSKTVPLEITVGSISLEKAEVSLDKDSYT